MKTAKDILEGKEEGQKFYTDQIYIDQARCGVNTGGRMTRKRTLHDLREKAKRQQSSWWGPNSQGLAALGPQGVRRIQDRRGDGLRIFGREGERPNLDEPRRAVVGDAGHPRPVIDEILDGSFRGKGEDRVAFGLEQVAGVGQQFSIAVDQGHGLP